jgi:hypothetical protein
MTTLAHYEAEARQILLDDGHEDPSDQDVADLADELREDEREDECRQSLRWTL